MFTFLTMTGKLVPVIVFKVKSDVALSNLI